MDPFDTLSITMPYASKELFHYCELRRIQASSRASRLTNCSQFTNMACRTGLCVQHEFPIGLYLLHTYAYPCARRRRVLTAPVSIASATADPHALRNVVLIAGLHYSWNAGDLRAFQSAFLFHKVESLRSINSGIENATPDSLATWARQICTLSLAEVRLGPQSHHHDHARLF